MLDFMRYITDSNVMAFMLLLLRFSGVMAFFPFFDNQIIPISVRGALAFVLAVVLMPSVNNVVAYPTLGAFILAGVSEILLGFVCGLVLQMAFSALMVASDIISFSMGLTMASTYDPMSLSTKPIVGQAIMMLSVLMALYFNFHHLMIEIMSGTLDSSPLGGFMLSEDMLNYFIKAFGNMMVVGFGMAFPIVAMNLLSDIIFGMIMKTHPQFNLLVVGFPVKIGVALVIITVIIPNMIMHFREELSGGFKAIWKILS